jgi:biopolymer transport protein ExbB/TolQ
MSTAVALALWLGCVYQLLVVFVQLWRGKVASAGAIGELVAHGSVADRIAPIAILGVLSWLLVDIGVHAIRAFREKRATTVFRQALAQRGMRDFTRSMPLSRARARAEAIQSHLQSSPQRLHQLLPSIAAVDAEGLEQAYASTRIYVWVLPVLGFIGTAWGMIHSINGFSEALRIGDIRVMTDRLGQLVIPGLSSAFLTTMLALAASVVTHFCVSQAHGWEHASLDELDRASIGLLATIPSNEGSRPADSSSALPEIAQILRMLGDTLSRLEARISLDAPARHLGESAQAMNSAAGTLKEAGEALHRSVNLPYHVTITRSS